MKRPLLFSFMALSAGILIGDRLSVSFILLLFSILITLSGLFLCVRKRWNGLALATVLILMFLTGVFDISREQILSHNPQHILHQADGKRLTIEGTVLSQDSLSFSLSALVVNCRRLYRDKDHTYSPARGYIRLIIPKEVDLSFGDFIRFHAPIKKIQSFHNPGVFDYQRYWNRRGIFVSGFIPDRSGVVLIRRNSAGSFKTKLERYRQSIKKLIAAHAPSPQKEILEAVILGNVKPIPQQVRNDFAQTGTAHILAISGLHISLVGAAGFFLFFWALKSSEYLMLKFNIIKIAAMAAFVPVILYAFVAGIGTTVSRATLMALACLTAILLGKKMDYFNILFGVALIILIVEPASLFDISFQLSFSAVFAILFITPKLRDAMMIAKGPDRLRPFLRRLYIFVLVSSAATLGTMPILIYYFNRISTVTVIANFAAVPLLGFLALIPALLSLIAAIFSQELAGLLISLASFFTGWAVWLIHKMALLPWSSINFAKPHLFEIFLLYMIIFLTVPMLAPFKKQDSDFFTRHPRTIKVCLALALLLFFADVTYFYCKDRFASEMKITAIDVGQGAATFIHLPRGTTMLIDGGGFHDSSFDIGQSVIAPFLYAQRIRKIDVVVLTHPHPDHLQGLLYIVNHFNVREVWCTNQTSGDELYRLWQKTLLENKVKIKHLSASSPPMEISGVHFQCLWPQNLQQRINGEATDDDINDASLVMKITFGTTSYMITGDISARVESVLIRSGQDLQSDVLFVPHHGSPYSSSPDFIDKVSCGYAVISAGKNNLFRHPHPSVLKRYVSRGAKVFRTDKDGAISIHSDGRTISLTPNFRLMNQ